MTDSSYTPGPWVSRKPSFFDPRCTRHVEDSNERLVARINFANAIQSENEAISNAILIAAAPDLLASLKSVLDMVASGTPNLKVVIAARAVIARATDSSHVQGVINK